MSKIFYKRFAFRSAFVAVWVVLWFFVLSPSNKSNPQCTPKPDFLSPKTATTTNIIFSYTSCDPTNNGRPVYNINFSDFKTEMGNLGVFKTGMYSIAKLKDLSLTFYDYSASTSSQTADHEFADLNPSETQTYIHKPILSLDYLALTIQDKLNELDPSLLKSNSDMESIAEIFATDFKYRFVFNDKSSCKVTSKRLIASYKDSKVALRGHVTITNAAGKTLQCNRAKWDIQNQMFNIDGFYVIQENGQTQTGNNGSFDFNLNSALITKNSLEEKTQCFAKSL